MIFTVYKSIEQGKATTKELKEEAARLGRDPDTLKIAPAVYMIPGETRQIAKDKMALIDGLARAPDAIALISEVTNFDFSKVPFDQPLSDDQMSRVGPTLGLKDRVVKGAGTANPTPGDFVTFSGRGTIHEAPIFCGTPKDIADELEAWYVGRPATASCSRRRTAQAPTRTSRASSCRNCSAGACFTATTRARPCARTSGCAPGGDARLSRTGRRIGVPLGWASGAARLPQPPTAM